MSSLVLVAPWEGSSLLLVLEVPSIGELSSL